MVIFLGISVEMMDFHVLMWKSRKKLESHARVDFAGGCKSIVFSKVLGAVFPPWGGILLNYPILVEMGGISPHFMEMGWFHTIFSSVGWKWCPGGPGVETPTKPMLFLCFLGLPGTEKCVSGWIFTKNAVPGAFLVKITKMGGIPRNSTIFTKFSTFGRSPPPGAAEGHGIYMYYKGFCRVRRGQEKVLVFTYFTMKSRDFTINHDFTQISRFGWIFMKWHENHGIGCTPAPGRRNSMYYCTILHVLGSQFRWILIIFMFFMKSNDFHEMTIKS